MAASKEMEIAIKIAGKVEKSFGAALNQAKSGIGSVTKSAASSVSQAASATAKGIGNIAKMAGAATAAAASAVAAMGASAVNVGKDFETAMSQVSATMLIDKSTKEGQKAYAVLEDAARECGRSTAFSASAAAEGLNYLALAGYDAEKAAAALPTVLNLAGAGVMELADASNMVTDAMSALGIEATEKNLNSFADNLAMTASKSNTSVSELGEAILTVGGTAKYLAGGTTELSTCIGLLADNGIHASEGGTKLRNMITSLTAPTDKAAIALNKLGVNAFDSQGNMREMQAVFQDLNTAMAGMSTDQKSSLLSQIFNKTDLKAVNALLGTSTQRWDELSGAIADSAGACEDMYAIQLDNLEGDIKILQSGLSDLGISVYQDLNGPLREMTQLATGMVEKLSGAYKEGGMEGMAGAIGDCLAEVVSTALSHAPDLVNMGIRLLENLIAGITQNSGEIADAGAKVLSIFIMGLFTLVPQIVFAGIDIITRFAQSMAQELPKLSESGGQAAGEFINGVLQQIPVIAEAAVQATVYFTNGIVQNLPAILQAALTIVQSLVDAISQAAPTLITAAVLLIGNLILGIIQTIPQLVQMGIQLIQNLVQGLIANLPLLLQMGTQIIVSLTSSITQSLPHLIQGGFQLVISLVQGIVQNLPAIAQAAVTIILSLIGGLVTAVPQLIEAALSLPFVIIDAILETDWLQVGLDLITAIGKGIIGGAFSIGDSIINTIKGWFGGGKSDADASSQGASAAQSYAAGFESSTPAVSSAASSLSTAAFGSMDLTSASKAGAQAGTAFTTGLAGTSIDTDVLKVDTSGLEASLAAAGSNGAKAVGKGIKADSGAVTQAAEGLGRDVDSALDNGWSKANAGAQTAMQQLVSTVSNAAQSAADSVKSAFENMSITIPKPRIPVINVSSKNVPYGQGDCVNVPEFSVGWNALGGIFRKPTIFHTPAGMQGVGEAGAEAILPLEILWAKMKDIVSQAVKLNSGSSVIDSLVSRLERMRGGGGTGRMEFAGTGGMSIHYSPVYHLHGTASKREVTEADKISRAEFARMMKQYEKDNGRSKFKPKKQ